MKYLPNSITCSRIVSSIGLLFLKPLSIPFLCLFSFCGLTDVLDGYIARKTGNTSKEGAILDSVADMVFLTVMLFIFIPLISFGGGIIAWIIGIAVIRIASLVIGCIKYKTFAGLHTYANKAAGLVIFCFPFIYLIFGINETMHFMLMVASVSAIEEMAIIVTATSLHRDRKSVFTK